MFFSRSRILLLFAVLLVLGVITLSLSILLLAPERTAMRTWNKYYTLNIEFGETTEQLIMQILESRRFDEVVSRFTSRSSFNTFAGFDSATIYRLADRLDPLDPRFDSYLQRLGKLFTIDDGMRWEVVYLRSDRNLLSSYLNLRGILREAGVKWRLIDFVPLHALLKLVLAVLFLSIVLLSSSGAQIRLATTLAALPWLPLVVISDFPTLLAFFLLVPAWANLFEHMYTLRYIRSSHGLSALAEVLARPAAVLAAAAGLGLLLKVPGPFAGVLMAIAGGAAAVPFLYVYFILQDSLQAHRSFRALPILRRLRPRRRGLSPEVSLQLVLAFIVLCSYPLLRLGSAVSGLETDTIRMRPIGGNGLSWRSLRMLSDYSGPGGIPNLADYLAHRAFQESLIFGRPYRFPAPGERILISDYRVDPQDTRIQKTYRVVKQFKESWLYSTLDAVSPGTVARLLADQGYAGVLEIAPAADPVSRYGISVLMIILFLMQFLVPRYINLTASVLYATRSLTLRRR